MIKKYVMFFIICFMGIGILSGCKRNNSVVTDTDELPTLTPAITDEIIKPLVTEAPDIIDTAFFADLTEEELIKDSVKLAEKLGKGKFTDTVERFSKTLEEYVDEAGFQTIWDSTVLLIGDYEGVLEELTQVVLVENYAVCIVVLEYELNGLQVTFTYNDILELEGVNISYYMLDSDMEQADDTDEREIPIILSSDENPIYGLLTLPKDIINPPVVILIQGSGQSDMDETIGLAGNKPFRDIARGLADKGIASIRYNKRFYQDPSLAEVTSTIYDEVLDDARLAVLLAVSDERVDSSRIYIAGHSLGGMLAPKIAQMNSEVSGIISLAGSPRKLEDIIYDQNRESLMQLGNFTEDEINELMAEVEAMILQVKNLSVGNLGEPILGATGYYWESLNEIDAKELAKESTLPMLFLQGSDDFQVYADVDFALWQEILAGKENVEFRLYNGLNHIFMKANGLRNIMDYDLEAYVEKEVIDDMAEWILTGSLTENE